MGLKNALFLLVQTHCII
ncbi:hypothetical protein Golob_019064, partial [Gossypium lobatum]|nr:hypothetical protein [Gossypium lobatum]